MVVVHFETPNNSYSERVAIFDNEKMYEACLPTLKQIAKENRMIVTESIIEGKTIEQLQTID